MRNVDSVSSDTVNLYLALRRKKDNPDLSNMCFRQIISDEQSYVDLYMLKERLRYEEGIWRVHKTVNARSVAKAYKVFQHTLIDHPEKANMIESLWKTCLLKTESKAERKFLIDVDGNIELCSQVETYVRSIGVTIHDTVNTPNGFHIITDGFDSRQLTCLQDGVEIKKDGYIFVEKVGE